MNGPTKLLLFAGLCVLGAFGARALSTQQLSTPSSKPEMVNTPPDLEPIDVSNLAATVAKRSLFMSKTDVASSNVAAPEPEVEQLDWSPFDFQLIGVSVIGNKKTGWFKNSTDDRLVSARKGSQLGGWTLKKLSRTEANLQNGGESVSLKLFTVQEPR